MVSFTHEQNSICSQKQLNDIVSEHTIICRQLFAGHVVGSRLMKRKKHFVSNDNHKQLKGRARRFDGLKFTSCSRRSWIVWFEMSLRTSNNKMKLVIEFEIGIFCEGFR